MARPKLICHTCQGCYAAKPKRFPKMVLQWREVELPPKEPGGKPRKAMQPVCVGFMCWKCVRKGAKAELLPKVRKALNLGDKITITKHHIREFFKLRDSGGIKIEEVKKDAQVGVDPKAGGAGTEHS